MTQRTPKQTDILLRRVRIACEDEPLDRLHAAIELEIASVIRHINHADDASDEYYLLEELLGVAFVIAQTYITRIRSCILELSMGCEKELRRRLSFVNDKNAYDILKIAGSIQTNSPYTTIEAINAIANYWKHREEWPTCMEENGAYRSIIWDTAQMNPKHTKYTVEIVTSLGMAPDSTGQLRAAVKLLGVANYEDLSLFRKELKSWASNLYEKARLEIGQLRQTAAGA